MSSQPLTLAEGSAPQARSVELADLIDRRPMSAAQLAVVALCTATLIVDGYDIQVMALTVPSLAHAWSLPPSTFGLALSAVVIGITVGSGFIGPLGDRFGRRAMLIVAMAAAAVATAATALAASPGQFVIWRCITGTALGASIPSCAALTSEFSPVARRSFVMGLMNSGPPIGAFSAGFIAPPVLEAFGWRGAFLIGGAGPLVIALLALWIPESLKFLFTRSPSDPRIVRSLRKVAPDIEPEMLQVHTPEIMQRHSRWDLVRPPYLTRTLLLWGMICLNLFNLYVLVSWLPTILQQSGWNAAASLRGAVLIQAGGVIGGLSMSRLLDRGATKAALIIGFSLAALCMAAFAVLPSGASWIVLLLLIGAGVSGSQLSLNTLSAAYYPPAIKATGVAWALLIGGIGSIIGPLAGAWLIELGLTPVAIVALLALPSLLCAAGAVLVRQEWQAH
jgi:AAHS family 4-hydroxybenzoate transporter-like MFS transporter